MEKESLQKRINEEKNRLKSSLDKGAGYFIVHLRPNNGPELTDDFLRASNDIYDEILTNECYGIDAT